MKRFTVSRRFLSVLLALLAAVCAGVGGTGEKAGAPAATGEQFTLTMQQELFSPQPPDLSIRNNEVMKRIADFTGTVINVNFVPTSEYTNKTNVLIASNNLPMVIAFNGGQMKDNTIVTGLKNGAFWPIGNLLPQYGKLVDFITQPVFDNARLEGVNYGVPRLRVVPRNGMFYRKDWADKLKIAPPKTLEELTAMAKAFTENDPDGNGQKDTWGMEMAYASTGNNGWNGVRTIATALGAPNAWGYENGKMVPDFTHPGYMAALDFYRNLYAQGWMNKDFAVLTGNKRYDVFCQGKAGMIFGVMDDAPNQERNLKTVVPTAALTVAPAIVNPAGGPLRASATAGFNGQILFNKTGKGAIAGEADLKKALRFYDMMCTPEMQDLMLFGIEGVHYKKDAAGKRIMEKIADGNTKLSTSMGDLGQILPQPPFVEKDDDNAVTKEVFAAFKARVKDSIMDPSTSLTSTTFTEVGKELDQIIMDANVKYILGELNKDGYQKAIATWRARGGDKVLAEYGALYEKYSKK